MKVREDIEANETEKEVVHDIGVCFRPLRSPCDAPDPDVQHIAGTLQCSQSTTGHKESTTAGLLLSRYPYTPGPSPRNSWLCTTEKLPFLT
eukprot:723065-Rhodomonas_salina.3